MIKYTPRPEALLVLADGSVFYGKAIGKVGTIGGEICFNTGMTGYQEIYTDPSYFGQIIVNTTSHIGNYGTLAHEQESDGAKFSGLVCDSFAALHSRKRADFSLQDYLERAGIVGIAEVDTRMIVRHIRSKGAMNALISSEILDPAVLLARLAEVPPMLDLELSTRVTTAAPYDLGTPGAALRVAVLDYGIKTSILRNLTRRDVQCRVFPATTSYTDLRSWQADGYFLSNGPGDPGAMDYAVETVRALLADDQPVFGICLGHQLLARAHDVPTYKMHHGHRGLNHPVKNLLTGRSEITSQNHGFSVDKAALEHHDRLQVTHLNLNDGTIEGIRARNGRAFSVQYHPESAPGPHDSTYLFDEFVALMRGDAAQKHAS